MAANENFEVPHATTLTNSLTPRNQDAKDPFEKTSRDWKDEAPEEAYIYGPSEMNEGQPDFFTNLTESQPCFRVRILQSPFTNHVLRKVAGGAKNFELDGSMQEDYTRILHRLPLLGPRLHISHFDQERRYHASLPRSDDCARASGKDKIVVRTARKTTDLALLWTAVDDPLGVKERTKVNRTGSDKDRLPTRSWASGAGAVDFLVSQRWRAIGDGVMAVMDKLKQSESSLSFEDQAMFQWIFNLLMWAIPKVGLQKGMTDEHPFRSEITIHNVQDGQNLRTINPNRDVSSFSRCPTASSGLMLHHPPPVEFLHIEAKVVNLQEFWNLGGRVVVTDTRSWHYDLAHSCNNASNSELGGTDPTSF